MLPGECAGRSGLSRTKRPNPKTRPAPPLSVSRDPRKELSGFRLRTPAPLTPASRLNLVHREGFEPSYLRGGADLQSAGFNHSPTCAELKTVRPSSSSGIHRRHYTSVRKIVQTDFRKSEEQECARICQSHANTTLGKFPYGVPLENLLSRRAQYPRPEPIWSWRRDLNP